jgi:hypothetical protein
LFLITAKRRHTMHNDSTSLTVLKPDPDADELAAVIRDELSKVQRCWSNALDHAMNVGDALIAAQPKVAASWKKWLRQKCFVAVSTAELYMQLARHRDQIEAELQRNAELSLRAARRLIAKPALRKRVKTPADSIATKLVAAWKAASNDQRRDFLDGIGIDEILVAMSAGFGRELRDRVSGSSSQNKKRKTLTLASHEFRH